MTEDSEKPRRGRRPYQRGVDPSFPKNNRFRRFQDLCGLSIREASEYLDTPFKTTEAKSLGVRGSTAEDEAALLGLWREIIAPTRLDDTVPAGARRQQLGYWEATRRLAGEHVDESELPWDLPGEGDDD